MLGLDFVGPFEPDADDNVFALVGVEAGTNYGMVRLLKNKDADTTRDAVIDMRRELLSKDKDRSRDIVRIHTDDDGSFQKEMREWIVEQGIQQTDTGGYRPKNNAKAERRIRTLTESFRAMLLTAAGGVGGNAFTSPIATKSSKEII